MGKIKLAETRALEHSWFQSESISIFVIGIWDFFFFSLICCCPFLLFFLEEGGGGWGTTKPRHR